MVALTDEELATQEWPHLAIHWVCQKLLDLRPELDYGVHSHCAHALRLYDMRVKEFESNQ